MVWVEEGWLWFAVFNFDFLFSYSFGYYTGVALGEVWRDESSVYLQYLWVWLQLLSFHLSESVYYG